MFRGGTWYLTVDNIRTSAIYGDMGVTSIKQDLGLRVVQIPPLVLS